MLKMTNWLKLMLVTHVHADSLTPEVVQEFLSHILLGRFYQKGKLNRKQMMVVFPTVELVV